MINSSKTLNAFLDARSNLCYTETRMLNRIIILMAMAAGLVTSPVGLASRSCILISAPVQQACKPACCANKTCCATANEHKSSSTQPLGKSDSNYRVNATSVALPAAILPGVEFAAQHFSYINVAFRARSLPTLALICIRLI